MQQIEENISTLLREPWNEEEGCRFWAGYDDFLDRIGTMSDDERTISMMVLA